MIFPFLLFGCSTRQHKVDEIYYVIKHTPTIQDTGDVPPPPPPPTPYYGDFNFILLDGSVTYFHNKHIYRFCGTGIDHAKPPRVFLIPDHLTKISMADLPHFLTTLISDSIITGQHFFASISSPTDTIRNGAFKIINDFFRSKIPYSIRNWTEEEHFVTIAKIENKEYNPNLVDWKVGFDVVSNPPMDTTNAEKKNGI